MGAPEETADHATRNFTLQAEHELRFEIPSDTTTAALTLQGGSAELFGIELALKRPYKLSPALNAAAFTWHGATLTLSAPESVMAYTATDTPMPSYISAHAILQSKRALARAAGIPGPRAVVVGPRDSGKTALVTMLAAYSVKANSAAVVVDVDPSGCGAAGVVPGSVSLSHVRHLDLEGGGLVHEKVASFMLGHTVPRDNDVVSRKVFESMGKAVDAVLSTRSLKPEVGCLVDTSGDLDGRDGADAVIAVVKALRADVVLVVGAERLYAAVQSRLEDGTECVLVGKSGGVVSRDDAARMGLQAGKIKQYFYGIDNRLSPFSTVVDFGNVKVLKVGGIASVVPDSVLPIGAESTLDPLKPVQVGNVGDVLHKILAVSQAKEEEEVLEKAVYGFLHVVKVDNERNTLTVLAPSPGKIPGEIFLAGDTKWIE